MKILLLIFLLWQHFPALSQAAKSTMEQRLTMITLGVKDLDVASKFYEEKLGWKKLESSTEEIVFFQLQGILLSLYGRNFLAEDATVSHEGQGFRGVTISYNTRSEQEVDQLFAQFEKVGVTIVKPPQKVFWGGYSGYISDLDGHLWEIAYNPYLEMDSEGLVR